MCAVTCFPVVAAHQDWQPRVHWNFGLLPFHYITHAFISSLLLLDCHLYDKLTNLEGEDEFGTNIFNAVYDRRNILIRRDFIKIYIGGSVG